MKTISFSLFGRDPVYAAGAIANANLAREVYPDWTCRFYVGASIAAETVDALKATGAEVVDRSERLQDWSALLWRFQSLTDLSVEAHLFRDCDSRLTAREAAAVEEWLTSGAEFHIIRDHPEHYMPILAGMWGCTAAGARRIANMRPSNLANQHRFVDQLWLRDVVYPIATGRAVVHDEFGIFPDETPRRIPVPRGRLAGGGWEFIGQGFNVDDRPLKPEDAFRLDQRHEWQLFDEGTIPECTRPEWYAGRERAPHLEEGHRPRMMRAALFVAQAAWEHQLRTVVDLGAGDGGTLSLLGKSLRAWGYDLSPENVTGAKERGVDVRLGDVVADAIEWADIAMATEMLEHLVDPHAFLREAARHARVLVCSSPADERPGRAYEYHTWAWDETGYRQLVEQAGYAVRKHVREGRFQVLLAVRP